jgi:hypothetical protein
MCGTHGTSGLKLALARDWSAIAGAAPPRSLGTDGLPDNAAGLLVLPDDGRKAGLYEGRQRLVEQLRSHAGALGRLQGTAADGAVFDVGSSFDGAGRTRRLGHGAP